MSPYHSVQIRCVFLCSAQDGKADLPNLRPTEHAIWLHRRGARGWNPSWQLSVGRAHVFCRLLANEAVQVVNDHLGFHPTLSSLPCRDLWVCVYLAPEVNS